MCADITGSLNEIAVQGEISKRIMTISPVDAMISIVLMLPYILIWSFYFAETERIWMGLKSRVHD